MAPAISRPHAAEMPEVQLNELEPGEGAPARQAEENMSDQFKDKLVDTVILTDDRQCADFLDQVKRAVETKRCMVTTTQFLCHTHGAGDYIETWPTGEVVIELRYDTRTSRPRG